MPLRRRRQAVSAIILGAALISGTARSETAPEHARLLGAADSYVRHIYAIYLGLRACGEIADRTEDNSFRSEVPPSEARSVMHTLDAAAIAAGVDTRKAWAEASPRALASAEALKVNPAASLAACQRMGRIFRTDEANLQSLLHQLGSRVTLVPKDF